MCNEIVADLTGLDIASRPEEGESRTQRLLYLHSNTSIPFSLFLLTLLVGLRQLVLLNTLLYDQDGITASIAKQRLIFFVKHVTSWMQDLNSPLPIRAEIVRALTSLLPLMSDIYGEHWGEIMNALASSWKKTTEIEENESGRDR